MFHQSNRTALFKSLWLVLIACSVLIAVGANAADDFNTYARGHAKDQVGGFWYFFKLICLVGGGVVCAISLGICVALAFEKASPQLQQIGYKGPVIAAICGGILCSITWFVGMSAKTASGTEIDNNTWQDLNGGSGSIISPDTNFNVASQQPIYYVPTV